MIRYWYFCLAFSSQSTCITVTSSTTIPHFVSGHRMESALPSSILYVKYWRQQSSHDVWPQPKPMICCFRFLLTLYYFNSIDFFSFKKLTSCETSMKQILHWCDSSAGFCCDWLFSANGLRTCAFSKNSSRFSAVNLSNRSCFSHFKDVNRIRMVVIGNWK